MGNLSDVIDDLNVKPLSFDPVPEGNYLAEVIDSELVPTSAGTGIILKVTHSILEGEFEGRKVFTQFNIQNPSERAQQIGRGMLSALCKACGFSGIVSDSSQVHGLPHIIKVKIETSPGYADKNKIVGFKPTAGIAAKVATPAAPVMHQEEEMPEF